MAADLVYLLGAISNGSNRYPLTSSDLQLLWVAAATKALLPWLLGGFSNVPFSCPVLTAALVN